MRLSQLAVQLHTVRSHCQTAADLAVTAKKIRAIGYPAVQLSSLGPIPESEILSILQGEGLVICATHEPAAEILAQPGKCIERLQRLGCGYTAYPFPKDVDFNSPAQLQALARQLDAAGARFRAAGLVLAYHNHALEFVKLEGVPFLEYLYAHTAPDHLAAELDTYWVHYGGGDIVRWCQRLRGRLPLLHLKDYGFTAANQQRWCEIGAGTLPWKEIIAAAERSGCKWFIVEQDTCPGDPFESLQMSFDFITGHLLSESVTPGP